MRSPRGKVGHPDRIKRPPPLPTSCITTSANPAPRISLVANPGAEPLPSASARFRESDRARTRGSSDNDRSCKRAFKGGTLSRELRTENKAARYGCGGGRGTGEGDGGRGTGKTSEKKR